MSFVYFIAADEARMVKIGVAGDPWKRLSKVQSDTPQTVRIAALEAGDLSRERELHEQFSALRVRGEWFSLTGELSEYIAKLPVPMPPKRGRAEQGCTELSRLTGWGKPYCSQLLNNQRRITLERALFILARTGWRLGPIADATDEESEVLLRFAPSVESEAA